MMSKIYYRGICGKQLCFPVPLDKEKYDNDVEMLNEVIYKMNDKILELNNTIEKLQERLMQERRKKGRKR